MTLSINYHKRKNTDLFKSLEKHEEINLSNIQNYIPLYKKFFSLNESNYNSINLNHKWAIHKLSTSVSKDKKTSIRDYRDTNDSDSDTNSNSDNSDSYEEKNKNVFSFIIKDSTSEKTKETDVFFKMAPLLNPFKYLVGKYNINDSNLFNLPTYNSSENVHHTMLDANNSAYVDGCFTFLSSMLIHKHNFIHGVDYYGSFLAHKNKFMVDIIDDLNYLTESDFFNKNKDVLFTTEDYSHLLINNSLGEKLKPIKINSKKSNVSNISNISAKSISDELYEGVFEPNVNKDCDHITLNDLKDMSLELIDIDMLQNSDNGINSNTNGNDDTGTNAKNKDDLNKSKPITTQSDSSCSSRTSRTNSNDDCIIEDCIMDDCTNDCVNEYTESSSSTNSLNNPDETSKKEEGSCSNSNNSYSSGSSFYEDEKLYATINKFPVQVIAMEYCENTFDNLIETNDLTNDEWISALMQIIMILITYQQAFAYTHNDLHTNNVMYNETDVKHIYYLYKNTYYKVPTYGRIFKIIDHGRSIYKFNNNIFCSDSYQAGGDASTQYNTEPYFNELKPRLDPNFSFDLCRLACSLYDFVIEDVNDLKDESICKPYMRIINDWCIDDNNINVLYKNNGVERYPGFKLYKMIARHVHKHVPKLQLERPEFARFKISKSNVKRGENVMNIDEIHA
jgi:hypothetical protein